jgi:hypothetical protein
MAKHRKRSWQHRLAAALRGSGIVIALVACLFAGAKLMSFAAGPSGEPHADAIGQPHARPGPGAAGRRHGAHHPRALARSATPDPAGPPSPASTSLAAVSGRSVTAVGDSVMVAATPALDQALPGIYIDAMVGRQFSTGLDVIAQLKAQGLLRQIVVVGLGTNGTITSGEISQLFAEIGPHRRLVLVNTFEDRSWEQEVNSALAAAARSHPSDVVLADWYDTVRNRTNLLWPDGIHPQPAGGVVYAHMLKAALEKVAGLPG